MRARMEVLSWKSASHVQVLSSEPWQLPGGGARGGGDGGLGGGGGGLGGAGGIVHIAENASSPVYLATTGIERLQTASEVGSLAVALRSCRLSVASAERSRICSILSISSGG